MLVVAGDTPQDSLIAELPRFLKAGDVMVFNDTKVIPARLFAKRGEAKIELLLHKDKGESVWQCFAKPAKKLKPGDTLFIADDFAAEVVEKLESGEVLIRFDSSGAAFYEKLVRYGHMPLPPYIERQRSESTDDSQTYQTVYAKHEGSVAAPTAGLHFTDALLAAIDALGVVRVHVTLHVGGGTFLPVKTDDTSEHLMHSEYAMVTQETADAVNTAKQRGGRVIAVGTTSMRTLESATDESGKLQPFEQETAIFITPGYRFKMVDVLLTNFHLPRSTLFMLVSAFSGLARMQAAYAHAIKHNYRFYSYGDACLLFPNGQG
jgi:S-adenosylmethionine:tRNA ribosyltransferase-isomerase